MAKKFFYVCAGLLMLAASYQLGIRNAGAQGAGSVEGAQFDVVWFTCSIDRRFVLGSDGAGYCDQPVEYRAIGPTIPGASPIVSTSYAPSCANKYRVLLTDGSYYGSDGGAWTLLANLSGAAVPSQASSWGAVKVRAR